MNNLQSIRTLIYSDTRFIGSCCCQKSNGSGSNLKKIKIEVPYQEPGYHRPWYI